jgi:hypothetical protein
VFNNKNSQLSYIQLLGVESDDTWMDSFLNISSGVHYHWFEDLLVRELAK